MLQHYKVQTHRPFRIFHFGLFHLSVFFKNQEVGGNTTRKKELRIGEQNKKHITIHSHFILLKANNIHICSASIVIQSTNHNKLRCFPFHFYLLLLLFLFLFLFVVFLQLIRECWAITWLLCISIIILLYMYITISLSHSIFLFHIRFLIKSLHFWLWLCVWKFWFDFVLKENWAVLTSRILCLLTISLFFVCFMFYLEKRKIFWMKLIQG